MQSLGRRVMSTDRDSAVDLLLEVMLDIRDLTAECAWRLAELEGFASQRRGSR